jgi:hypothetical protein
MAVRIIMPSGVTCASSLAEAESLADQPQTVLEQYMFPAEIDTFERLIAPIKNGRVAEVGSYHGLSLSYINAICRENGTLIHSVSSVYKPEVRTVLFQLGDAGTVKIMPMDPHFPEKFSYGYFDLVLLRVPCEYDSMRILIRKWMEKVTPGGVLAGFGFKKGLIPLPAGARNVLQG